MNGASRFYRPILTYRKQHAIPAGHGQRCGMRQAHGRKWGRLVLDTTTRPWPASTCWRPARPLSWPLRCRPKRRSAIRKPPFFCHEGTERSIARPNDRDAQALYYPGKQQDHIIKNVIVVDARGRIWFLSAT
jgi:hypothetical protein